MNCNSYRNHFKYSILFETRFAFGLIILAAVILFHAKVYASFISSSDHFIVGITQIVPHPSLDKIRQGIMDTLKAGGISEDKILFENALGNIATATQIAHKFVSYRVKVIVPLTTPSTQAALSIARPAGIPIIYSAVSSPVQAKLIPSLEQPGDLITGISDFSPLKEQINLIRTFFPTLKKIGVIYNAGEANSVALINAFEKECSQWKIQVVQRTVTSTNDVSTAADFLCDKVEAIYIPNDNMVISALTAVLHVTTPAKVPVFSADPESVEQGCLATISHDQYALGQQAGRMIIAFLKGRPFTSLFPEQGTKIQSIINLTAAERLNIKVPPSLCQKMTCIKEIMA